MAKRIQRKRIKGWRMPEGAVYVGRPSKWGNPFYIGQTLYGEFNQYGFAIRVNTRQQATDLFRERSNWRTGSNLEAPSYAHELRGKDLACWCPLDQPCHADVLLEWANAIEATPSSPGALVAGSEPAGIPATPTKEGM